MANNDDVSDVRQPLNPYLDLYSDRTPKVEVEINGETIDKIGSYTYDSDLLQLGDPCCVVIPDPYSQYTINEGDPFRLWMTDPDVGGGKRVPKLRGLVTDVMTSCEEGRGTTHTVAAADLGWHLVNDDAPIWRRIVGRTYKGLFDLLVDPTWGFAGFRAENDSNVRLKLGGNYARATATAGDTQRPPIMQIEPGEKPADRLIEYAKLINRLVNVSADGYLQLFKPRYDTPVVAKFYRFGASSADRVKNNIQHAQLSRSLATRWTKSICVGTNLIPATEGVDPNNPNVNSFRGTYEVTPSVASDFVSASR